MQHFITQYISEVGKLYKAGNATEHSYRPALKTLLESLTRFTATNEPKRIACGAPDYIITDHNFTIGYVEAKDVPVNLNDKSLKEQFDRYKHSLDNLIITNYLTFRWFTKGELVEEIAIGRENDNKIIPLNNNFDQFIKIINQFASHHTESIKTSTELSKRMAAKAKLLAEIIETALEEDIKNKNISEIYNQYKSFENILIANIKPKEFADLYAQTVAYGMFAAKISNNSTNGFTRVTAATTIPQSNPFLRKMFQSIAGFDLDTRIAWIVDALADLFNCVDISKIYAEIWKRTENDPIIHFYEDFLTDYDKKLKKQRGVWYSPQPVVSFIVRAIDDILKSDFGISDGLADKSKITINENEYHKVQILDPATGTGTFLAEIINHIYDKFKSNQGMWNNYVNEHIIPRLNGFEILMASYAMAHIKLEMLLQESGATINNQRLKIFLTDSLDEDNDKDKARQQKVDFAKWLADEANEAAQIKRDTPVMVILGNPPYSVSSSNKGKWIVDLCEVYKKNLNERNIQPLSDDYIKFIRLGQHFIEKNGEGILAYISNNSFIDGLIHRQMRKNLIDTFDKIYILDLHGNAKKKETALDGSEDKNVFDIQQGASINIFVKTKKIKNVKIYHHDLFGKREEKYNYLLKNNLQSVKWKELKPVAINYFFVPKDFKLKKEYEKGFKIDELFNIYSSGIKTQRDDASIKFTKQECKNIKSDFLDLTNEQLKQKYGFVDVRDWTIDSSRKDIKSNPIIADKILYRPFDSRFMNYTGKTKGVMGYPRYEIMQHFIKGENIGLMTCRQQSTFDFQHVLITKDVTDMCAISLQTKETGYIFPLYLYQENFGKTQKVTNISEKIVKEIAAKMGVDQVNEIRIFDYIYAVLHSPAYRKRYKEFLKIDFPRIPYPENGKQFECLAGLGEKLRKLHLMEKVKIQQNIANFPVAGTNEIEKPQYGKNKVFINENQYFDNVPLSAWEFYIGGYQPAQKWLKDRKERTLDFDEVQHYQKMIAVLCETEQIMKEIDINLQNFK
jgi:predicted helicase